MRTTLDIDSDVLEAAKELAAKEKTTAGRIISEVFRKGIQSRRTPGAMASKGKDGIKNGVPLMPSRGDLVTSERIRKIMDDEGI
ncbi:MAG: CopG family transcriptional regulator [Verrucomicrobia bacterium]|jgi:hypothetical protein|nr:CopG family transcriptional regulator [Verrucomicrobiota bacterium]|tara:strand:- start:53864 stop:54115 length:252 start_codon:yes stop_codon:yes gene_type:complete